MQLEKELKYTLTKEEHDRLARSLKAYPSRQTKQVNYYFDDQELSLRKKKAGLRIRISDGKRAEMTLKETTKDSPAGPTGYKIRKEWEVPIRLSVASAILKRKKAIESLSNKVARRFKKITTEEERKRVGLLGKMFTTRKFFQVDKQLLLELDAFRVFGVSYYELEVETNRAEETDAWVRKFLRANKVRIRPCRISKLRRFLTAWKARKNR